MDCLEARTILSASLDGETGAAEERVLADHLAGCAPCRTYAAAATGLHRSVRIAPAVPVPDLTATILAATALAPPSGDGRRLRLGLVAIATVLALLALPSFLGGSAHTQHLAAFDLALAIGFGWVASRPARALAGFLPIGTALVVLCSGLAFADAIRGNGESVRAVTHSVAVLGMIVAWLLEARTHRRAPGVSLAA